MASRQEEKERRRRERQEREQAEARSAARRKRLQYAGGGVLALALVAAVVVLVFVGIGGEGSSDAGEPQDPGEAAADVQLPQQQTSGLEPAAKAAGCKLANPEIEGATHEDRDFTSADYKTNPPTSGNHNPDWYEDGIYEPGGLPRLGMAVHTLEHGRIDVQYKPGTPAETVSQLEALLAEQSEGYHMLLFENASGMEAQVAATAWGHSVTCPRMNDEVFDALRTFRAEYIDKGPESVP